LELSHIKKILKEFTTETATTINFDEFLVLLSAYEETMMTRQQRMSEVWATLLSKRTSISGSDEHMSPAELTALLSVPAAPELALSPEQIKDVVDDLCSDSPGRPPAAVVSFRTFLNRCAFHKLGWIQPLPFMEDLGYVPCGELALRVMTISDLTQYGRTKLRGVKNVSFQSIDPLIVVRLGNSVIKSTVATNSRAPIWHKLMRVPWRAPSSNLYQVHQWLLQMRLHIDLFDYQQIGVVPHIEWVAGGSIPLSQALRSTLMSSLYMLHLFPSHYTDKPVEISLQVHCRATERRPLFEILPIPDEWWWTNNSSEQRKLAMDHQASSGTSPNHRSNAALLSSGALESALGGDIMEKKSALLYTHRLFTACRLSFRHRQ
jgi:hypothetical protein